MKESIKAPLAPAPVEVSAPGMLPAKRKHNIGALFRPLVLAFWPYWGQKYRAYMKWAAGNDDRLDAARRKFWIALASFAGASLLWWIIFFLTRGWKVGDLFDSPPFLIFIWVTFNLLMNFFSSAVFQILDYTAVVTKKNKIINYLMCNERLHWTEFPEPKAQSFVLGTSGKNWIPYGWLPPLYERAGFSIIGDLGKGRPNAVNYLIACGFAKADTICFCLDGKPSSGVGFRHLRGLKHVFIADEYEMIIKTVKWLTKILSSRIKKQSRSKDDIDFPRILIVCDEDISKTFLPGFYHERERRMIYKWPEIHKEMTEILSNGHGCDMHIISAIEPSETWLAMDNRNRPHFEEISFYYSLPRETEKGIIFFKPHDHPFLDVFSVRIDGEKVVGKMPFISDKELSQWIETKAATTGEATASLWEDTLEKLPLETIGERIERDELIWVNGNLVRKSRVDSGEYQPDKIDLGATEEFYRLHHAPKFESQNGNDINGKQAELEIEKGAKNGNS